MRYSLLALTMVLFATRGAIADDPPKPPAGTEPADKPPAKSEAEYKGVEVNWALSLADALEEAAQRNILVYVHSHGST